MRGTQSHSTDSLLLQLCHHDVGSGPPTTESFISGILTHLSALMKKGEHKKYFETRFRPPKKVKNVCFASYLVGQGLGMWHLSTFQGSPEPLLYHTPYPILWGHEVSLERPHL